MHGTITLDIPRLDGSPVPHWFMKQQEESTHLAVLLPGRAYGLELPLLLYPTKLLHAKGADILGVDYTTYTASPEMSGEEIQRRLSADIPAALDVALRQRSYERITLLGKSLGTIVMAQVLESNSRLQGASCIWMTPLLRMEALRARIVRNPHPALFIGGTADEQFDLAHLPELENATGGKSVVIEGADHSLEIQGHILESIDVLRRVMEAIDDFIR